MVIVLSILSLHTGQKPFPISVPAKSATAVRRGSTLNMIQLESRLYTCWLKATALYADLKLKMFSAF